MLNSALEIRPLFFTSSQPSTPPPFKMTLASGCRIHLKMHGSQLLRAVFRGFYRLQLWLSLKRPGCCFRLLWAIFINFFYSLWLPLKRPGSGSPTLIKINQYYECVISDFYLSLFLPFQFEIAMVVAHTSLLHFLHWIISSFLYCFVCSYHSLKF